MPAHASIVIPTRGRPAYLEVALASIAEQARDLYAEVLVVDDGVPSPAARELAERYGARYQPHPRPLSLNAARNTGVEHSHGQLVVFVDDDVRACPGWLAAILRAAREHPEVDVLAGRILASLEGRPPRGCGRERPPITTLELGSHDRDVQFAWGANMAIRRSALERVGPFDVSLEHGGDEQEWQERLRALEPGARVLYVADASVEHRRVGRDAQLRALARTAYVRGRAARRFDARRGQAPALAGELVTLARCAAHVGWRRCALGLTMVAHSGGRLHEALLPGGRTPSAPAGATQIDAAPGGPRAPRGAQAGRAPAGDDFLSGSSGAVGGLNGLARGAADAALDVCETLSGRRIRLARAARRSPPPRRVLVLGVQRPEHHRLARAAREELLRSRHRIELHTCGAGAQGKFENLDRLLLTHPAEGHDWLLVVDDDVELPGGFLDRFLFLCERFSLSLAQPAHRLRSHAAWPVTRRRACSAVRETGFVEIGPVSAFAARTFPVVLPFPKLHMGWGLDVHWGALAREHGWRCGVVDAVPVRHIAAPVASSYAREEAVDEARSFLSQRPYLSAREADRTLAKHRRW